MASTSDLLSASPRIEGGTPLLAVREVAKRFRGADGREVAALVGVSLAVYEGEFVALVGPSGSGKTTLLSILAGLESPTSGTVALRGDVEATRLGRVGYMPQRDLLLPWRSALDNAIAGLEAQGVSRAEARERARSLFADFGLAGFEREYSSALSGGMRQRVAFARTVLAARELLLLDEPFGALDALTRAGLQRWLLKIWGQLGATCLLVTHDIDEALLLADRLYVLTARPGRVRLERHIPLERPRRVEMLARPEIAALKAELLAALVDEGAEAPGGEGGDRL
ncbi:MAG TPA: ABC transporter ATP-binding protein [Ktedonobacterales bacterium]|jgi:ABC-type nitrate/sulfonate/bicarbonate transport system ATPase subunit|nr:ABC transporter ATP-binding protein [Ktedonobacterales bacterium]